MVISYKKKIVHSHVGKALNSRFCVVGADVLSLAKAWSNHWPQFGQRVNSITNAGSSIGPIVGSACTNAFTTSQNAVKIRYTYLGK